MPDDKYYNYWVITADERAFGPFDDWAKAYEFGCINLGFDGWTVTVA